MLYFDTSTRPRKPLQQVWLCAWYNTGTMQGLTPSLPEAVPCVVISRGQVVGLKQYQCGISIKIRPLHQTVVSQPVVVVIIPISTVSGAVMEPLKPVGHTGGHQYKTIVRAKGRTCSLFCWSGGKASELTNKGRSKSYPPTFPLPSLEWHISGVVLAYKYGLYTQQQYPSQQYYL